MERKSIILIFTLFTCFSGYGQTEISIEDCYARAKANYPLIKQYALIERSRDYKLSNVSKVYLPQVQLSAKASYQSEVTQIPIDFSRLGIPGINIPELSKDQYGATAEVSQIIWDGGTIGAKRRQIQAESKVEQKELDVNLYAVNERINQLFFGILLCDAMMEQNRLFQDELQRNYDRISSYVQNGIANESDLDVVKVEQLKARQSLTQIVHSRKAYLEMMSAFIGEKLEDSVVLQKPDAVETRLIVSLQRPELSLFDANLANIDAAESEISASLMPKLGLFLTGGYGKPGLNMLKNEFSPYYIGGVRLT